MRFSVECAFPHLRKRGDTSRKGAFCADGLTENRTLQQPPHGKPHSATVTSRKTALCTGDVTEKRTLRVGLTKRRILHASGGCAESLFSPICVHSCIPTAARATGRGHGSHDIDGPMAPVMPERSDLRPTPPGR